MKTNMLETSLLNYFNEVEPTLQQREKDVIAVFRENLTMDFTNKEIAYELFLDPCSITGRVYRLRGKGKNNPYALHPFLVKSRQRKCRRTGKTAIAWQLNNK